MVRKYYEILQSEDFARNYSYHSRLPAAFSTTLWLLLSSPNWGYVSRIPLLRYSWYLSLVYPPLLSLTSTTHLVNFHLQLIGLYILVRCAQAFEIDSTRLIRSGAFLALHICHYLVLQPGTIECLLHPFFQLAPIADVLPKYMLDTFKCRWA